MAVVAPGAGVVTEYKSKRQFFDSVRRAQAGDEQAATEIRSFADNPGRREQAIRDAASGSGTPQPRSRSASAATRAGSQLSHDEVARLKAKARARRQRS